MGKAIIASMFVRAYQQERKPAIPATRIRADKRQKIRDRQDRKEAQNW